MYPITVAIADYDESERTACESLLRQAGDIWVVAQTTAGEEVLAMALRLRPQVLLCSLLLAADEEFSLLRSLQRECPETRVVLLGSSTELGMQIDLAMLSLRMGARGYVSQRTIGRQLARAVRQVNKGEVWVPRRMLGWLLEWTAG